MGCSRNESKQGLISEKVEYTSLSKFFEKYCPIYLSYGMSYDSFWYGDIYETYFYKKANELYIRRMDEFMWQMGSYIYEAILDCSPILRPFSKEKKPLPYSDKPYLLKVEEHKNEPTEQEIENERLRAQIWANNLVRNFKNKK